MAKDKQFWKKLSTLLDELKHKSREAGEEYAEHDIKGYRGLVISPYEKEADRIEDAIIKLVGKEVK